MFCIHKNMNVNIDVYIYICVYVYVYVYVYVFVCLFVCLLFLMYIPAILPFGKPSHPCRSFPRLTCFARMLTSPRQARSRWTW